MDSACRAALPCAYVKNEIRPTAVDRRSHRGLLSRDRGTAVHPDPLRHGRRGDQDREPRRRRRHAQGRGAAGRREGGREPLLHDLQSRQEECGARLHQTRGPGGRAQTARERRRDGREFPAGRAEEVRARLSEHPQEVSEADLSFDLGLRADRAAVGPAGLRSGAAGRVGHDERQRRGRRRGPAPRHRHRRHHDGDPFVLRDQCRALRAHLDRQGPAHRPRALRHRARLPRQHGLVLPDRRRPAQARRQRPLRLRAEQLVRHRERQDLHGRRQPEAVRRHLQGDGPSRVGDRSALPHRGRARRQQAGAHEADGRRAEDGHQGELGAEAAPPAGRPDPYHEGGARRARSEAPRHAQDLQARQGRRRAADRLELPLLRHAGRRHPPAAVARRTHRLRPCRHWRPLAVPACVTVYDSLSFCTHRLSRREGRPVLR
jgi:hypothetical protein